VNAQLADALSDWCDISGMAESQSGKAQRDSCTRPFILQLQSPLCERISLADIEHR
jgi:hypothetical protein